MMTRLDSPSQRGWTLIELLVASAVVAALALLSISVANRVVSQGKSTACVGRLKNIGSAILLYAQEHRNTLPGPQGEWIQLNTNLPRQLGPYLGYLASTSNEQLAIWECPGNSNVIQRNASPGYPVKMAGYLTHPPFFGLYNHPSAGNTTLPTTTMSLQEQYLREDRWLLRDIDHMAYGVANAEVIGGRYGPVHSGGRNVFYLDGEIRWVRSAPGIRP